MGTGLAYINTPGIPGITSNNKEPSEIVHGIMRNDTDTTARPILIRVRLFAAWRRAVLAMALCAFVAASGGCSWVGLGGDELMTDVSRDDDPSQDRVATALAVTWDQMQLAPREPYWAFHLGELYAAADSLDKAIPWLEKALELDPTYAPSVALLSKLYYDARAHDEGVTLLDNFLAGNDRAPDALRAALALHLEAAGDWERAQEVLDQCHDTAEVQEARTFLTLRGDELDSALETAKRALESNPKSAANHNNYGIALLYAGRPIEAREAFRRALDRDDELPGALYNMAIVEAFYFFNERKAREWFTRYQQYASDDPDDLATQLGTTVSSIPKPQESR